MTRIALNLLSNFGRCEILTILSLLAFEQTISDYVGNHLFSLKNVLQLFSLKNVLPATCLLHILSNLSLKHLTIMVL